MNKKLIFGIIAVIVLVVLALIGFGLATNAMRQQAQAQGEAQNSIFHTVPEGGDCRPDMGDCEVGLTCGEGLKCVKP